MTADQQTLARQAIQLVTAPEDVPDWAAGEHNANPTFAEAFPHANDSPPSEPVQQLALTIYRTILNGAEEENIDNLWEIEVSPGEAGDNGLFLCNPDHESWGPIEPVANLVRAVLEHFDLPPMAFEWGSFSPHSNFNEFSGGAVVVAAGRAPESFNAHEWTQQRLAELTAPAPAPPADDPQP